MSRPDRAAIWHHRCGPPTSADTMALAPLTHKETSMKISRLFIAGTLLAALATPSFAQVEVKEPWVRATVPAQTATGAFMQLRAKQDARLVQARSPVAGVVEIHEMKMVGDVMKMNAVPGVDLPAGQTVELAPGGYHIMLLELKRQVKEGDIVPLTLVVEGKDRKRETIEVRAVARPLGAASSGHHHP
jgi:copper(I)-binding protein